MSTTTTQKGTLVEVMEKFHFKGEAKPRMALVTWRIGDGERRAVSVRELDSKPAAEPAPRGCGHDGDPNRVCSDCGW